MPNYKYKCVNCDDVASYFLPISSDPKRTFRCVVCGNNMVRKINKGEFFGFKTWAGDWFKKTYGHDIYEPYEKIERQKKDMIELEKELRKELKNEDT